MGSRTSVRSGLSRVSPEAVGAHDPTMHTSTSLNAVNHDGRPPYGSKHHGPRVRVEVVRTAGCSPGKSLEGQFSHQIVNQPADMAADKQTDESEMVPRYAKRLLSSVDDDTLLGIQRRNTGDNRQLRFTRVLRWSAVLPR